MKRFSFLFFMAMLFVSSCYKEEKEIIHNLAGQYYCTVITTSRVPGMPDDTSFRTIEFKKIASYPRKLKLTLGPNTYTIAPNFSTFSFQADGKDLNSLSGRFYGTDSVIIHPSYGPCPGCGATSTTYIGKKQ
ncbi:MAG TPA: hypothetical protein VK154_20220 [Chitinophagales bacterium]|nr:hypothetical protein [Chitinophagales bacterium]